MFGGIKDFKSRLFFMLGNKFKIDYYDNGVLYQTDYVRVNGDEAILETKDGNKILSEYEKYALERALKNEGKIFQTINHEKKKLVDAYIQRIN